MAVHITKDDTFQSAMEKLNREVDSRRTYGVRREELPTTRSANVLKWSNASAEWWAARPQVEIKCRDSDILRELVEEWNKLHRTCSTDFDARWEAARKVRAQAETEGVECKRVTSRVQCLDANEIAVTGVPRSKLMTMAKLLNPLPLYAGSFEARQRGIFSLRGIEVPPVIAKQRLDDLDKQAIDALIDKAMQEIEE